MTSNVESGFIKHIEKPKRIQRKRVRGWRMPENTVYVGRPSKWGNPWKVDTVISLEESLTNYRRHLKLCLSLNPQFLELLRGKDLACWCPLSKPCHADILLEFLEVQKP